MDDRHELDRKILQFYRLMPDHRVERHLSFQLIFAQPVFDQPESKFAGVNRAFQQRPYLGDGAEMVLVSMGDENALEIFGIVGKKTGIGKTKIDPRVVVV